MLAQAIRKKLQGDKLSVRAGARHVGIAHTTLIRAMNGDALDLETVQRICEWVGISVSDVLNTSTTGSNQLAADLAVLFASEPRLANVFHDAVEDLQAGRLSQGDLNEIIQYAAYKLSTVRRSDTGNEGTPTRDPEATM